MIDFIYTIPVQSINLEEVHGIGFEFGSNILIEKTGSNINFSYSYLEMNNMNSNIPLFYRPKQRLRFTMVQESPIATFQFSSRYTSSQLYEDFLSDDHPIENNTVIFPLETLPETILTDLYLQLLFLYHHLLVFFRIHLTTIILIGGKILELAQIVKQILLQDCLMMVNLKHNLKSLRP